MKFVSRNLMWTNLALFFSTTAAAHDSAIPHLVHTVAGIGASTEWVVLFALVLALAARFSIRRRLAEKPG